MTDLAHDDSLEAAILALHKGDRTASGAVHEPEGNAKGAFWGASCLFDLALEPPVGSPLGRKAEPILIKGLLAGGV